MFVGSVSARVRDQLWRAVTEGTAALEEPRHGGTAAGGTRGHARTPPSDTSQRHSPVWSTSLHTGSYAGRRRQRPPGA
ncbi:hypothetical protein [Streptomyces sp. enrichment culture]|uniref:hypothetical protein n=1 Tax=Streptomyces sp. enrichment culture TaxID=1795815 RepID=UPI003F554B85